MVTCDVWRCGGRSLKYCFSAVVFKSWIGRCPDRVVAARARVAFCQPTPPPQMLNSANPNMASLPLREERAAPLGRAPLRGACRSLFGPIDHEELRGELKRQLKEIQARDCQRWNFDFQSGNPLLGGTYRWEAQQGRDMPSFYRETPRQGEPESRKENGEAPRSPSNSPAGGRKGSAPPAGGAVPGGKKTREAKPVIVTDFFPKRKRSCSQKMPGESCGAHRTLLSMEQTPRKKIR